MLAVGGFSMASEIIFVVFGAWLEDSFSVSLAVLGGAALLIGSAELLGEGATFAFTDRLGKRRAVLIGLIVSMESYGLLAFANSEMVVGLGLIAVAILGFEFAYVSSVPLATALAPDSRARYLAWMVVAIGIGRSVGAAIGPVAFQAYDLKGPALVAMLLNVAAVLVVATQLKGAESGEQVSSIGAAP